MRIGAHAKSLVMPPGWPLCVCEWKRATECQSKIALHSAEKTVCIDAAAPPAIRPGQSNGERTSDALRDGAPNVV